MTVAAIVALLACPGPHTPDYDHPAPSYELVHALALLLEYEPDMRITSGVRCPRHNAAVGGSTSSKHLDGEGADVTVPADTLIAVAAEAVRLGLRVLVEGDHLHLDLGRPGSARMLVQTATGWQAVGPTGDWTTII